MGYLNKKIFRYEHLIIRTIFRIVGGKARGKETTRKTNNVGGWVILG
jgi:hypothetical protein